MAISFDFSITLIDSEQFEGVFGYIGSGTGSNAVLECGGKRSGLDAGFFMIKMDVGSTLSRVPKVGTVRLNCLNVFDAAPIPFGGYRMSGIGRENGICSLKNYLQVKAHVRGFFQST